MKKRRPLCLSMRRKTAFTGIERKKQVLSIQYVFVISFLLFIIFTFIGFVIVEKGIRPSLIEIAKTETQRVATLAINDAISKEVLEDVQVENLLKYEYDDRGRIQAVTWNTSIYHDIQHRTVKRVQSYLHDVEQGKVEDLQLSTNVDYDQMRASFTEEGIVYMIPLGQATNKIFFAHLGPKVPVRFSVLGDVSADIGTSIVETGINNTYIEIALVIEAAVRVVIPFASETTVVSTSIPIANFFHTGEIPDQYRSRGNKGGSHVILKPPSSVMVGELDLDDIINNSTSSVQ